MTTITLTLDTAIDETRAATATIAPGTIVDIGAGTWGLVGEVLAVAIAAPLEEPTP